MSARLRRNISLLRLLSKSSPSERKVILKRGGPDLIKTICECAENVLNGNVKTTPRRLSALRKHKNHLRRLVRGTLKSQTRHLQQKGGGVFIPALLAAALPTIVELLKNAVA
jgi:lipoate synthase